MNPLQKINDCHMSEDTAKLILRLTVGVTVFLHGWFKVMNPEALGFIGGLFSAWSLPAFLAYLVYIGEIVAPLMLIAGWQTKIASSLIAITLFVAILLAHAGDVFTLTATGGWGIELQALMLFGAVSLFGLGAGKYSVDHRIKANTVTIPETI